MIMLCSNILVAYNESELAKKSLEIAIEIAKGHPDIAINVLTVTEFPLVPYMSGEAVNEIESSLLQYSETILADAKERLSGVENPTQVVAEQGQPVHVILDYAAKNNCDLIIMGSRGLSGVKEFLGSVSHYVVQHSTVPVLLVK